MRWLSALAGLLMTGTAHAAVIVGDTTVTPNTQTSLFGGATPTTAFWVQIPAGPTCWLDDATGAGSNIGFLLYAVPAIKPVINFVTPAGYTPQGAVTIFCATNDTISIKARAW